MVLYLNMSKKKYNPFDHASHNLQVHNLLKENGKFPDWEVTTAFYASLKFFEGALFPEEYKHPKNEKLVEFKSYNDYRSSFNRFVGGTPHDAMKHFVKNNTDEDIWIVYKELYGVCHDSRYKNYSISKNDLQIAREGLESIKSYCIKNQK